MDELTGCIHFLSGRKCYDYLNNPAPFCCNLS